MSRRVLLSLLLLLCVLLGIAGLWSRRPTDLRKAKSVTPVVPPVAGEVVRTPVSRRRLPVRTRKVEPVRSDRGMPEGEAPERDRIADEYILSFYSRQDRDVFLETAKSLGVEILDTIELGFSVRIHAGKVLLRELLERAPTTVDFSSNYVVRNPTLPLLDPRAPEGHYAIFGRRALEWLGIRDNSGWGSGIKVAVLDTGVERHPSLQESAITRLDLLKESRAVDGPNDPHGTAVASLIAGHSESVHGIASGAEILSIRVLSGDGGGDTFTAAKGIVRAVDEGASVINCSFATRTDSFLLKAAVDYAAGHGVVIVGSTGNDAVLGVSYPAAYPEVVAVAAVDARGNHLYFANRGAAVDIAAPGLGIEAAWTGDSTALFSGTSAAAPLVSGAIAALLSQNPGLSAFEAADILQDYSNDAEAPGRDDELGNGILNMRRVEQRNEPGIYDVTLGAPYLQPSGDSADLKVSIYAQNTGTEPLDHVVLMADINGARHSLYFDSVQVGQTVSHEILLAGEELSIVGKLSIDAEAVLDGVEDIYPADNRRVINLEYAPPGEP